MCAMNHGAFSKASKSSVIVRPAGFEVQALMKLDDTHLIVTIEGKMDLGMPLGTTDYCRVLSLQLCCLSSTVVAVLLECQSIEASLCVI